MHVLRADDGRVAINDLGVAYFTLAASIGAPKVTMVFLNDYFEEAVSWHDVVSGTTHH